MRRRQLQLAMSVAALLVTSACSGSTPAAVPDRTATPYAKLQSGSMHVVRVAFCDLIGTRDVTAALGGAPTSAHTWANGAAIPGVPGADVGHELGCSWTGRGGRGASAWVFARPVSAAFAAGIVGTSAHERSCSSRANPTFGKPALTQICSTRTGVVRVRNAGLFTDSWVSCEVQRRGSSVPALRRQADAWCAAVAGALTSAAG